MDMNGLWFGVMHDIQGMEGEVALSLPHFDGDEARGTFGFRFTTSKNPSLASARINQMQLEGKMGELEKMPANQLEGLDFGGDLHATRKEDKLVLQFKGEVAGGVSLEFQYEGTAIDADPHAQAALYGCYAVEAGRASARFKAGYGVFWKYGAAR